MWLVSVLFLVLLCYCSVAAEQFLPSTDETDELKYSSDSPEPLMVAKPNLVDNVDHSEPDTGGYPVPKIVELSDVTWLSGDNLSIIFPSEELQIAPSNETDAEYGPCQSPVGPGHCRHFRYCVLNVFISLQADYLPYMCRINGYAGVCCTVQPALSTFVPQASIQNGNEKIITLPINSTVLDQHRAQICETLRKEIFRQFDNVSADLQELMKVFSEGNNKPLQRRSNQAAVLRVARSPLGKRPSCTVSRGTLEALVDVINTTFSSTGKSRDTECVFKSLSNDCAELVKLTQCGVHHLRIMLMKNERDVVNKWKRAYDNLLEKYNKLFDDLRRNLSQENEKLINKLKQDLQTINNLYGERLNQYNDKNKKLCISEIGSGKTTNAGRYFKGMEDDSQLPEIITSVYNDYGNLYQLENIVNFVKQLSNSKQSEIAYTVLFSEMKRNGHSNSPKILILFDAIKNCMLLSSLRIKMLGNVETVVDEWAYQVRTGNNYSGFMKISQEHMPIFIYHINKVIENAYANNVKNAENIFKFIDDLIYIEYRILALSSLFETMERNNHLYIELSGLAYRVKQLTTFQNYPNVYEGYKNKLSILKNNLPSSVRGLIWNGDSCTIRSTYRNEYLYSPGYLYDNERRYVFTWRQKGQQVIEGDWKFETTDDAKSFKILSVYRNEYLYAADNNHMYYDNRRMVFTWTKKGQSVTQGYWILELVDEAKYFVVKNTVHNEYLYAAEFKPYDAHRRRVFTWTPGDYKDDAKWEIKC